MEDEGHVADHFSGISATDGTWHHVAVTWQSDTGQTILYDNGRKVSRHRLLRTAIETEDHLERVEQGLRLRSTRACKETQTCLWTVARLGRAASTAQQGDDSPVESVSWAAGRLKAVP